MIKKQIRKNSYLKDVLPLPIATGQANVDLLVAARGLAPPGGLRPSTYETLFGLIASTVLRVSEELNLLVTDVDLKLGMLTVRQTKFAKSRQLPLHPTNVEALRRYRRMRNRHLKLTADVLFFVYEISSFSRAFKRWTGFPASSYRRAN